MEAPITTSFDRFARYSYLRRVRDEWFGEGPLRVLDVGDPYGTLTGFLPDDMTVSLDLFADRPGGFPLQHPHVVGSGFCLPFADGAFDIVATHDVYEHLPLEGREVFVAELVRVSAGPVVLVAPFADPRTAACEGMVNAYYVSRTGDTLEPLDEHHEGGLPPLVELESFLDRLGLERHVHGDGWLFHWLPLMLMKAHMVAGGMAALDRAIDTACNQLLRERDARLPGYRRAVVIRPQGGPVAPLWEDAPADVEHQVNQLTRLGWELVAVLRGREDLSDPRSALRGWVSAARSRGGDIAEVATSLDLALERARETLGDLAGLPPSPLRVTVVLVEEDDDSPATGAMLGQLAQQTHPAADLDVVVVAGRETPGRGRPDSHPRTRVVVETAPDRATRVNRGVEAAGGEAVLLLDPTLRIGPDLVATLAADFDGSTRALCVGADVQGGGAPALESLRPDGGEALYASSEAMLVQRKLYLDLGGLDAGFGGALDDVDLGWRMTNLGYRVVCSGAVVRRPVPDPEAEAEAEAAGGLEADEHFDEAGVLRLLVKNLQPINLAGTLAAELVWRCGRAAERAPVDPDAPRRAVEGVARLVADFDALLGGRDALLNLRRVSDRSVFARFGRPTAAPLDGDDGAVDGAVDVAAWRRLAGALDPAAAAPGPTSVVVIADEDRVAHSVEVARLAGADGSVVLATRRRLGGVPTGVHVAVYDTARDLVSLAGDAEVVITPASVLAMCPELGDIEAALVVDLREAVVGLQGDGGTDPTERCLLRRGDAFLVAGERQRDHWLGRLHSQGRPLAAERDADGSLRRLIDVVHTAPAVDSGHDPEVTGPVVVVDLAASGEDAGPAALLVSEVPALAGSGARFVLATARDGGDVHPSVSALLTRAPGGIAPEIVSGEARFEQVAGATIVVRPTGFTEGGRLASSSWALDAVAAGAALVVTEDDPAAPLVEAHGCGVVVRRPGRLIDGVRHLLDDPGRLAAARAGSQAFAAGLRNPGAGGLLRQIVQAPWGWQGAHRGGVQPSSPASATGVTAAAQAELEQLRAHVQAAEALLAERAQLIDALERRLAENDISARGRGERAPWWWPPGDRARPSAGG